MMYLMKVNINAFLVKMIHRICTRVKNILIIIIYHIIILFNQGLGENTLIIIFIF